MRLRFVIALIVVLLLVAWSLWDRSRAMESSRGISLAVERGPAPIETQPQRLSAADDGPVERAQVPRVESPAPSVEPDPGTPASDAKLGRVEVLFMRGGFPLPGVGAALANETSFGREPYGIHDAHVPFPASATFVESRSDGLAVFGDVAAGRYHLGFSLPLAQARANAGLGADPSARHAQPTHFVAGLLLTGRSYEVRLGSARLQVRVFGADGRPTPSVCIGVSQRAPDPMTKLLVSAYGTTNAHGDVEFVDFNAGEYEVVFDHDGRFDGFGENERQFVSLSAGETKFVQFGSPELVPHWRGKLTNARGQTIEGTGRLVLTRGAGEERSAVIATDGRFVMPIQAGTWTIRVHATGAPDEGHDLGTIDLVDRDVERDLVVPGARVQGRVNGLDASALADPKQTFTLSLRPEGHDYPAAFRTVTIHADGTYAIDGLGPGRWIVDAWPAALTSESSTVDVLEGVDVVDRDWTVASK